MREEESTRSWKKPLGWTMLGLFVTAFARQTAAHPLMHLMSSILLPSLGRAVETNFHASADARLAAMALACRLYATDHNDRMTPSLSAIVPTYLPAIPLDPTAAGGQTPLRFTDSQNRPRVYGVGENGVDDGGAEPLETGPSDKRLSHSDIVVPLTPVPRRPYQPE